MNNTNKENTLLETTTDEIILEYMINDICISRDDARILARARIFEENSNLINE